MITQEQIDISKIVQESKERYPESVNFMMDLIHGEETHCCSDLDFVYLTLKNKKYSNLVLMLDIGNNRYNFIVNTVFHFRQLLSISTYNQIDEYISKELVQQDIKNLFENYNSIKIEIPESYVF